MTARRLYWGGALLLVGLLLLASNFGYLEPFSVWGLWPILIIWPAIGLIFGRSYVAIVDNGRRERIRVGRGLGVRLVALWVLAGAGAQLLTNLGLITYDWGDAAYWTLPVLLVGLGIAILARPKSSCWWRGSRRFRHDGVEGREGSISSFAGEIRLGRHPWDFQTPMRVDVWAGDIDIDLTTARFAPGANTLYVAAWAADVDIIAPEGIDVVASASCTAGEIEIFGRQRDGLAIDAGATRRAGDRFGAETVGETAAQDAAKAAESSADAARSGEAPKLYIIVDLTFGDVRIR